MHGLSAKVSRYLSPRVKIPSHAQDQEHQHGTCAAELPGICNVNLVSDTMGDDISPSARSRFLAKPEKPTQDTPVRAECPVSATKSASSGAHSAQNAASLRMAKPAPQSVALYLPPFFDSARPPSARQFTPTLA